MFKLTKTATLWPISNQHYSQKFCDRSTIVVNSLPEHKVTFFLKQHQLVEISQQTQYLNQKQS